MDDTEKLIDNARYTNKAYVGSGGMASVYKAFDQSLRREVAIKEMSQELRNKPDLRNLFLNEARKMAAVKHDNVVQVFDIDEGDVPTIVMEYLSGGSLATRIGSDSLPVEVVLKIVRQVALGLGAIHDAGFVHRDIKPENILEEAGRYKITDFGVAMAGDEDSLPFVTNKYAAPEVLIDPGSIGPKSDIYSLGIMAIELILGTRQFELAVREAIEQDSRIQLPAIKDSRQAFWQQWVASDVELAPVNELDDSVLPEVGQFFASATARDRDKRVPDCSAFIEGIDRIIRITGERASDETEKNSSLAKKFDKAQAAKAQKNEPGKAKKPLWFKLTAGIGITMLLAIAALFLMPSSPAYYNFEIATTPEGATLILNGEMQEGMATPATIVATFGDSLELRYPDVEPRQMVLQPNMDGLQAGEAAYILTVEMLPPLSIETSQQAADYLVANLSEEWPVDASIPGLDGTGPLPIPLETPLTFNVMSNEAGSLILLHLSADNYATVIYPAPNGFAPDLEEGLVSNVGEELRLVAREPLGNEWMFFVVQNGVEAPPAMEGEIPVNDTMRAFNIAGIGSPGQQLLEWLVDELKPVRNSNTYLELEIVETGE